MKIITWNINGYRAVTGQNPRTRYGKKSNDNLLFQYIYSEKPDIICLQETKASIEQISEELKCPEGYFSYYHSATKKKGYSGVAIFAKEKPLKVNYTIGIERFDIEGRIIEAHFKNFILLNVYFPKGYADNERLDYKLEFYDALLDHCELLKENNQNIIISGDYNTAHKEIDLARPKQNTGTSGFMPIEREKLDEMIELGYVDAFRIKNKAESQYSWWSQRGRARENNVGWRIDYHFISNSLLHNLINSYIQPEIIGSDHCPVAIELKF